MIGFPLVVQQVGIRRFAPVVLRLYPVGMALIRISMGFFIVEPIISVWLRLEFPGRLHDIFCGFLPSTPAVLIISCKTAFIFQPFIFFLGVTFTVFVPVFLSFAAHGYLFLWVKNHLGHQDQGLPKLDTTVKQAAQP
jgi:hypothetical protein